MQAAIVTVGDELLAGETTDTNATWLAQQLVGRGVDIQRITTVPDRVADIARVVNEHHAEYDVVLITGGLGPTHDDRTMAGVAAAFGRSLKLNDDAQSWLETHGGYARDDLAAGTTDLPAGAQPLHNDVGVAPGCVLESVYVLPGVPAEMKAMFERIEADFSGPQTHVATVTADEPESALLNRFEELRDRFDVTVGSYPGEYVRVKIRGQNENTVNEAARWLTERVETA
ncbi:competence/damage-inducible protein A [Halocatena pleomorpha]|uniref:Competence/damage-inducible protein A n=1 Tax=Halocatena pleomorpha TaxID=1785090 RepID=A0A3P3RCA4_9EURY|nr:molybdopterin-binding protein [Halocatena pleomorpha]RRJ30330.1 competence/damage-inducible protein A [Halocatena pleomorpha]